MQKKQTCYLCGSKDVNNFFQMPPVPTQDGVMCSTKEEALNTSKGDIDLRLCRNCGFVGNEGHEESKISFDSYDFSNDFSPMYTKFTEELSDRLIKNYDLKGKTVLDVGCGDGSFLNTICKRGENKGIGIDPGFDYSKRRKNGVDITFIRDYYSEQYNYFKVDLITSRLVISLPNNPIEFISGIRKNLDNQPNTIVYFDIPNVYYTIKDKVIWNVVYEHRSWFCKESLTYMMELCGFEVLDCSLCWNDEYLSVEARPRMDYKPPSLPDPENIKMMEKAAEEFSADFLDLMAANQRKINKIKKENKKTIAWGAGARGVTFLNLFDLINEVPYIIDINSNRHEKYLPGSSQKIVAPEFIKDYKPELIIITNPTYKEEIITQAKALGFNGDFWIL